MLRSFRRKHRRQQSEPTLDYVRQHFHEDKPEEAFALAEKAFRRDPDNIEVILNLNHAARGMTFVAIWIVTARRLLELAPNHPQAPLLQQRLERLQGIRDRNLTPVEVGADHEWMQWHLNQGRFEAARDLASRVLKSHPQDLPSWNNLTLAQIQLGDLAGAGRSARTVQQIQPNNVHALSNLVAISIRGGNLSQAEEWGARLRSSPEVACNGWTKRAEAFAYLGADAAVLECYHRRDEEEQFLTHLAAVALARQGNWAEARQLWKSASSLEVARANQENASRPVGERHHAWPFHFTQWWDRARLSISRGSDLLRANPELAQLVPLWLDRGDPVACELAVRLIGEVKIPALLAALKEFALSQRGSDRLRWQAGKICREAGVLGAEPVRFWQEGHWRELCFLFWTVDWQVKEALPKKVRKIRDRGIVELNQGRIQEARRQFLLGLQSCPDDPQLVNNLACTYEKEGNTEKALELLRDLHQKCPDYIHARLTLASEEILKGNLDKAQAMVLPIMQRAHLHVCDFALLCEVQLQLAKCYDDHQARREQWRRLWENVEESVEDAEFYRPRSLQKRPR